MSTITQIQSFIDSLPSSVASLRIRIGDSSLQTVGIISIIGRNYKETANSEFSAIEIEEDEILDTVVDVLDNNGYASEFRKARIHACTSSGKSLKSKAITASHGRVAGLSGADRAIERLTDGLLSMAAEMRRTVATLSESLAWSEEQKREAEEAAIEARVSAIDHEGYARLLETLQAEDSDPMREQAATILGNVVNMFGGRPTTPTKDDVKSWVSNPDFVREMMADPEIALGFMSAFEGPEEESPEVIPEE